MWFIFGALLGAASAGGDQAALSNGGLIPLFVEERVEERLLNPAEVYVVWYNDLHNNSIAWHAKKAGVKGCLLGAALRIRPDKPDTQASMWFVYTNCSNLKGGVGTEIGVSEQKGNLSTLQ